MPPLSQGGPGFPASPIRCPRFQSNEEARIPEGSLQTVSRTVPPRIRKGIRMPPISMRNLSMWKSRTWCLKARAEEGTATRSRSPRRARKATSGGSSDGSQPGCGVAKALNWERSVPKSLQLGHVTSRHNQPHHPRSGADSHGRSASRAVLDPDVDARDRGRFEESEAPALSLIHI